jgi:hypothetical protein
MAKLQRTIIDLNPGDRLDESYLSMLGGAIELMLQGMFGGIAPIASVRGTPDQVAAFGDTLSKEKKYIDSFMQHGLNDPRSFSSRHDLERAVANFERETSIKWPFR